MYFLFLYGIHVINMIPTFHDVPLNHEEKTGDPTLSTTPPVPRLEVSEHGRAGQELLKTLEISNRLVPSPLVSTGFGRHF